MNCILLEGSTHLPSLWRYLVLQKLPLEKTQVTPAVRNDLEITYKSSIPEKLLYVCYLHLYLKQHSSRAFPLDEQAPFWYQQMAEEENDMGNSARKLKF